MSNAGRNRMKHSGVPGREEGAFPNRASLPIASSLILRGVLAGTWSRDLRTDEFTWSTEFEGLFGAAAGSFPPKLASYLDRVHPEDRPLVERTLNGCVKSGSEFAIEHRFVRKDGAVGWMESRGIAQSDGPDGESRLYGAGIDISERVHLAQELIKVTSEKFRSEARFQELLESATVGIILNDSTGLFSLANRPMLEMLGYTQEDVEEGRLAWNVIQAPDRKSKDDLALKQLQAIGRCDPYETEFIAKDGRRVPVYVGAAFLPGESEDEIVGASFVTDLTSLKQAQKDLISLNQELDRRVRDRTAELEEAYRDQESYNYSISHDLRAPLRAIVATARMIEDDHGQGLTEGAKNLLRRQIRSANRLAALVDDLLNLSRVGLQEMQVERVDLTALAKDVAFELHAVDRVDIAEHMSAIGDGALLRLVWENLIGNALKFSTPAERIVVGVLHPEDEQTFFVKDTGIGFDMSYAHRLFLPFERLVSEGEFAGSGIGLTNVQKVIQRHHGRVWAESSPGKGATFYFTLPVYSQTQR